MVVELTVNSMIVIFSGHAMSHLSLNSGLLNLLYEPNVQGVNSEIIINNLFFHVVR